MSARTRRRSTTRLGRRRVQHRPALADDADRLHQLVPTEPLQHVAGGPGGHRLEQHVVVVVRGQHEAGDRRPQAADLAAQIDARAVREAHVEHDDVRAQRRQAGQRLGDRAGLTDHVEVRLARQQHAQPAPDDLVVVHHEHPDAHGPSLRPADGATGAPGTRARQVLRGGRDRDIAPDRPGRGGGCRKPGGPRIDWNRAVIDARATPAYNASGRVRADRSCRCRSRRPHGGTRRGLVRAAAARPEARRRRVPPRPLAPLDREQEEDSERTPPVPVPPDRAPGHPARGPRAARACR